MKRIKHLLLTALLTIGAASASAQIDETFQFTDKNGNIVPDGSTCTFLAEYDENWENMVAPIELFVKNTTNKSATVSAQIITETLPSGYIQVCFPSQCIPDIPKNYTTGSGDIMAGMSSYINSEWFVENDMHSKEWFANNGKYGTATVTIQLRTMAGNTNTVKAYGPKITVNCVYADPTGIDGVLTDNGDTTINVYDASGKTVMTNRPASALMSLGKGLYICETMKDGKRVAVRKIVK